MSTSGSESNSMDDSSSDVYFDFDIYYIEDDCNIREFYYWDDLNIHDVDNGDKCNIHDTLTINDVYKDDKCNILDVDIHDQGPCCVLQVGVSVSISIKFFSNKNGLNVKRWTCHGKVLFNKCQLATTEYVSVGCNPKLMIALWTDFKLLKASLPTEFFRTVLYRST